MKIYRLIAIFLVLCVLTSLTACMPSNLNQTEPENSTTTVPTTTVPPTTATEAVPTSLCLNGYETGIDSSVINEDTFVALLRQADALLKQYATLTYDTTGMKYLFRIPFRCGIDLHGMRMLDMTNSEGLCTLYADAVTEEYLEDALYWVLNVLLIETYDDCCTYYDIVYIDQTKEGPVNRDAFHAMIIFPEYKDYGFETIEDFARAHWCSDSEGVVYELWSSKKIRTDDMAKMGPDLFPDILAKAFPEA